jgi:IS1 family transposase
VFAAAWQELTKQIVELEGSFGSRLHRADDGVMIAYACWPTLDAKKNNTKTKDDDRCNNLREIMKACIVSEEESETWEVYRDEMSQMF